MGNTPSGGSYTIQLGKCASMAVKTSHGKAYFNGASYDYEKRSALYCVDDRTCTASISSYNQPGSGSNRTKRIVITITDNDKVTSWRVWPYRFEMVVEESARGSRYLKVSHAKTEVVRDEDVSWVLVSLPLLRGGEGIAHQNIYEKDAINNNPIKTIAPDGAITLTSLNSYVVKGKEKQKGLVVIEVKKKSVDQPHPSAVIVSHYVASSRKTQAGFSVVAKLRGGGDEGGGLHLELEGPDTHPAADLFEMFDKVSRSGHWSPDMCPRGSRQRRQQHNLPQSVISEKRDSVGATQGRDTWLPNNTPNGGVKIMFQDDDNRHSTDGAVQYYSSIQQKQMSRSKAGSEQQTPSDRIGSQMDTPSPDRNYLVVQNNPGTIIFRTGPGQIPTGKVLTGNFGPRR